jgi:Zn-dependent protease with chaperone function
MESVYPQGPSAVPDGLLRITPAYRGAVALTLAALALFAMLYLTLVGAFAAAAYHALRGFALGQASATAALAGVCAAFCALALIKALASLRQLHERERGLEVTAADQPRLFDFLYRLADEAGASRPHRVFVSGRANAAVSYEVPAAPWLLPARKNLEIGLALVNVMSLGELKAVLAHELGHVSQSAMGLGRWVCLVQQLAAGLGGQRDALDRWVTRCAGSAPPGAWLGGLLAGLGWSLRVVLASACRALGAAQQVLSRQMELHADRVAVSLTGSDALIHALARQSAAEEAWERALGFADFELRRGRCVRDVFTIHADMVRGLVGRSPGPEEELDRVCARGLPRRILLGTRACGATHPAGPERAENCRRIPLAAPIDPRSAWLLFQRVPQLKERLSAQLPNAAASAPLVDTLGRLEVPLPAHLGAACAATQEQQRHGLYRAVAARLGSGWEAYLLGLTRARDYALWLETRVQQARTRLAGECVSARRGAARRARLRTAAEALYDLLFEMHQQRHAVVLDRTLARRLAVEGWEQYAPPCDLPPLTSQRLGRWLRGVDHWAQLYSQALTALRQAALEQLRLAEAQVEGFVRKRLQPADAPPPSQVPVREAMREADVPQDSRAPSAWQRWQSRGGALVAVLRVSLAAAVLATVFLTAALLR